MNETTYVEFMLAMDQAPWDSKLCGNCGGLGLVPLGCCSGDACGCLGRAFDYSECSCGLPEPTEDQLQLWLEDVDINNTYKQEV